MDETVYAVITGDIVRSSRFTPPRRELFDQVLNDSFATVANMYADELCRPFYPLRGDSFQAVITPPDKALRIALALQAALRLHGSRLLDDMLDARIAIGIGPVETLDAERKGDAFERSARLLDTIKGPHRIALFSNRRAFNPPLSVMCSLIDVVCMHWSAKGAEAFIELMRGNNQYRIAEILGIAQSSVNDRLRLSGALALEECCIYFEQQKSYFKIGV